MVVGDIVELVENVTTENGTIIPEGSKGVVRDFLFIDAVLVYFSVYGPVYTDICSVEKISENC